ncbi:MAG: FAD synthetase family protein, partial [Treponema sp.]|nr:FAD synthetase family protein [Treponema sp.]
MQIVNWQDFLQKPLLPKTHNSSITVGVFDGVHRGHKELIKRVVSRKENSVPVAVTFRQNGHKFTRDNENQGSLISFRQKMAFFVDLGIEITVVIEFSESFRHTSGEEFMNLLHERGNMTFLAVGSNFRCGYQLDTDSNALKKMNATRNTPTDVVPLLTENGTHISSTEIRSAIKRGDLRLAQAMLGYPFTVDLEGAIVSQKPRFSSFDLSALGRILPPSGEYSGFLVYEADVTEAKRKVDFSLEDKTIRLRTDGEPQREGFRFIEFSA